jgi:hypothetical protein
MTNMTPECIAARLIDLADDGADPDGGRSMTLEELEASFAEHEKNFPEEPESERSLEERAREEASRVPLTQAGPGGRINGWWEDEMAEYQAKVAAQRDRTLTKEPPGELTKEPPGELRKFPPGKLRGSKGRLLERDEEMAS